MSLLAFVPICMPISNKLTLFETLRSSSSFLLTPNTRLSTFLHHDYQQWMHSENIDYFPSPNILPINQFIQTLWHTLNQSKHPCPLVAPNVSSDALWQRAIKDVDSTIVQSHAFVETIKTAWRYCINWQIDVEKFSFSFHQGSEFFYQVTQAYKKYLNYSIDETQQLNYLLDHLELIVGSLPKSVVLTEFDSPSPLQKSFFAKLATLGVELQSYIPPHTSAQVSVIGTNSIAHENEALIDWIKSQLQAGKKMVGCAVVNLAQRQHALWRALRQHFDETILNISLGSPLIDYPLVYTAKLCLNLNKRALSVNNLIHLLQSPYLDLNKQAQPKYFDLISQLSKTFQEKLSFNQLKSKLRQLSFYHDLLAFFNIDTSSKQPLSKWSQTFKQQLTAIGFLRGQKTDSHHYQIISKLIQNIDSLAHNHFWFQSCTHTEALDLLNQMLASTLYQPQQNQDCKVHIMGLLEASGLEFDALWVMGLTDNALPERTRLSPFIPPHIQKENAMPHSLAERELLLANQLLEKFSHAAPKVMMSYYQKSGSEHFAKTPLIQHWPEKHLSLAKSKTKKTQLEWLSVTPYLHLSADARHTGPSSLIKEQALCPFRAYAKYRLKIKEAREVVSGLDDLDRGTLVHRILETFWQETKTQAQLLNLTEAQLSQCINTHIQQALDEIKKKCPAQFDESFYQLETQRLMQLIGKWLEFEKSLPPFAVIETEKSLSFTLNQLCLNIRLDRVDRLQDGRRLIIDYKTGQPSVSNWFGERPIEPQLPLYCLADSGISGAAYYQIRANDIKIKGLSDDPTKIKGIDTAEKKIGQSWDELKRDWQTNLENLADEYSQGYIMPSPQNPVLCESCDFQALCRLHDNKLSLQPE